MLGTNTFSQLLARSPVRPLQEHMECVAGCAEHITEFFKASNSGDWVRAEECYQYIKKLENQADDGKKQIRLQTPRSLFMAIPRNDLLTMVNYQDKVANTAKDIAGLMLGRQMQFPEAMREEVLAFVESSLAVVWKAKSVIDKLSELLETGFGEKEIAIVEELVNKLGHLEHDNDDIEIKIRAQLHKLENTLSAVDVIFMYKVIDRIGKLANSAQKVGDHVHIIVAR